MKCGKVLISSVLLPGIQFSSLDPHLGFFLAQYSFVFTLLIAYVPSLALSTLGIAFVHAAHGKWAFTRAKCCSAYWDGPRPRVWASRSASMRHLPYGFYLSISLVVWENFSHFSLTLVCRLTTKVELFFLLVMQIQTLPLHFWFSHHLSFCHSTP